MPKSPPKYDMTSSVPCFPSFLVIVIPLNGVSIPTILTSLNPWLFNIFLSESFWTKIGTDFGILLAA
jgi:hypothetical protein